MLVIHGVRSYQRSAEAGRDQADRQWHLDEHLAGQVDTELPMHFDAKTLTTRDGQEVTMVSDLMIDSGH